MPLKVHFYVPFEAIFNTFYGVSCDVFTKEFKVRYMNSAEFKFKININPCTCCVEFLVMLGQKD